MKTKLSFTNKKRLLLLFVLLVDSFLFDVHPACDFRFETAVELRRQGIPAYLKQSHNAWY